ncbi:hypothetical protein [Thalassiella azotivora]
MTQTQQVQEIVVFQAADGVSHEQMQTVAQDAEEWIRNQPGFLGRVLSHDAAGDRWVDQITWASRQDAEAAAAAIGAAEPVASFLAAIDMSSVLMLHTVPVGSPEPAAR